MKERNGTCIIAADLGGFGRAHSSIDSRKKYAKNNPEILREYMNCINITKVSVDRMPDRGSILERMKI